MLPRAILAAFNDNFERQRQAQVVVYYVQSRTEECILSIRKYAVIYQRGLFTREFSTRPNDVERRKRAPFHLSFGG